ncbi:tail fiber protein [Xenorhabdus koppenhoeferi]|uniref:Phage Tail Collar Domain n=1 Tax=Xenorhabdus koppenhoeferi TaxID=351659 RepID=A0A1I7HL30_9GAMM|nr:tail fiber protein [Xenorhabdus koppenhoeferi]SFU61259.1 Phage Tail Collar Domain [Xenorhabdus koppenhoeferi]
MKDINHSTTTQNQHTLPNKKGVGPETVKLKDKFKEGSIPLQTDFNQLIDIADVGRKACGQSPQQDGPGTGLKLGDDGKLNLKIGSIENKGFSPLTLENDILSVKLGSGLINKTNEICVSQGNGITVDSNGVSIDPNTVLPTGIIVMFSGSNIPTGWALCDGKNGTPDLIDRFIMGGTTQNIHGQSLNTFSGSENDKKFTFISENQTVHISGRTEGHALTAEQNGPHKHEQGEILNLEAMCHNGSTDDISNRDWVNGGSSGRDSTITRYRPYTFESGEGKEHSHNISLTSGQHSHNNNVTVPYYILAFIIKL